MNRDQSCTEMLQYLESNWDDLWDGRRAYLMWQMTSVGCREVIPYLLRHLENPDPGYRRTALNGLGELKCRECRARLIGLYLNDVDEEVRKQALLALNDAFRGERDKEILQFALAAYDNPKSSVAMRLAGGAVMMYQLDIPHDELGNPAWWNEDEEELSHPSIQRAVKDTRQLLGNPV